MEVYIQGGKTKLSANNEFFIIKDSYGKENKVSKENIDILILQNECSISSKAIVLALENDIPIILLDGIGRTIGKFWDCNFSKNSTLRRNQYRYLDSKFGLEVIKSWIIKKIKSQKEHLEKIEKYRKNLEFTKEKDTMNNSLEKIDGINEELSDVREKIMGYEGVASRAYYLGISKSLPERWNFCEREYQNSKNPYNLILNYLFGMLYVRCETELVKVGLDPYAGILHSDGDNKKSLLYDYIEQFRFLAWDIAYSMFSRKKVALCDFEEKDGKVEISKELRKELAHRFYQKLAQNLEVENQILNYKEVIKLEAKDLAQRLEKL
ncbi:CRISPR-associated endonuclease Cas1 [Candidatus Cetobacterium colombiensis]|uniref:CRISPR-associated endonuclease Cas1 n=1 Tax=Candidatus Cetobacterium colombiensis TaxID=3073100 RepID=A0ABU4WFI4_9FUSO|nr:CRISPR-associated endonuclease Cas1 [Candidatus Cetobacterium colombiensis]MDX8337238.1 CRISPR-associated endonuclease Cas1 [Candidatus Cetobacterium colombiensis]